MFIKVTRNPAGQAYYHLVESYRDEHGQVRQRMLISLGRKEDGKLEGLGVALDRHREKIEAIDLAKDVSVSGTYVVGPLLILKRCFEILGIETILGDMARKHEKLQMELLEIIFALVAARFIRPGSKLSFFDDLVEQMDPRLIKKDIQLHQIYRSLDLLCEHKEEIEQGLFWQGRTLFNQEVDVVLYDLTTLRFESTREDLGELRRFGYSKERRSDCTQVVFGLLLDTDGMPLGFEVYPGNTFEGTTVESIVKKMRKKFRIRRMIFVADRGLFSAKNLERLREDGGEFIVGQKLGVAKKEFQKKIFDLESYTWIDKESLACLETKTETGDRLIVTWSRDRAERDAKTRADILEKISKKLQSKKKATAKTFVSNSNYQKFLKGLDEGQTPSLNQDAIDQAAKRDGFFGIVTNVETMSARDIVGNYKQLWKIEDSFGELKGTLRARPVFHWTDGRIVGHLVLCFLAYLCEAFLTKRLREENDQLSSKATKTKIIPHRPLTVVQAMKELAQVRSIPVSIKNQKTLWVRTDIPSNATRLFHAAGVRIPPKVLHLDNNL